MAYSKKTAAKKTTKKPATKKTSPKKKRKLAGAGGGYGTGNRA